MTLATLAIALAAPDARTRDEQELPRAPGVLKSGVDAVMVTATVVDSRGQLVAGLERDAFEIFEDGERQAITVFTGERVPIGLGLLLDVSDSMYGQRLHDARTAVERFLFELLDPADESFVVAFNHYPRILTRWTSQPDDVRQALNGVKPFGGTAIYDAVLEALPVVATRSRQRAAMVVISDGADTASDRTVADVRTALLRSDAFVYAIAIDSTNRRAINTRVNAEALKELTAQSGGRTEIVHGVEELGPATARIAAELNQQYVLGYASPRAVDGRYHSIRVRMTRPGLKVRARNGYVGKPPDRKISR